MVGVVTAVTSATVGAVESTVKEVIVRVALKFDSEFSLLIVLVTVIVQSVYVPSLRELKMMGLLPEIAMVVLEEQEPPKVMAPDWVELNV